MKQEMLARNQSIYQRHMLPHIFYLSFSLYSKIVDFMYGVTTFILLLCFFIKIIMHAGVNSVNGQLLQLY